MTDVFEVAPTTGGDPFSVAGDPGTEADLGYVKNGRYYLPDPDGGKKPIICTRATTWAKDISDTFTLNQWGLRMALKGVALAPSIITRTAVIMNERMEPGAEKAALQPLAEEAKNVAAAREPAEQGTGLHSLAEQIDRGDEGLIIPPPHDRALVAYSAVLAKEGLRPIPDLIERIVLCKRYKVAGKFDRVLKGPRCPICRRTRYIGDLKTGRDLQYGWNEISVQLGIYAYSDLILDYETNTFSRMPLVCRHTGYVMHAPVGQGSVTLFTVDLKAGWYGSALIAKNRAWKNRSDLAEPVQRMEATGSSDQGYVLVDYMITWEERIAQAPTVGELIAIRREGKKAKEWSTRLEELLADRQKVLELG